MPDAWSCSCVDTLQICQRFFGAGNVGAEFLAAALAAIASLVAGLEEGMEFVEQRFGKIASTQTLFDDGFGDGVGREIETFAESFLQQPKEGGEEGVGLA